MKGDNNNAYYWGRVETAFVPYGYEELFIRALDDNNPKIPQDAIYLFDNIEKVFRYPEDTTCTLFLTKNSELYLFSPYSTTESDEKNSSRLFLISDNIVDVFLLNNNIIIAKDINNTYYKYALDSSLYYK